MYVCWGLGCLLPQGWEQGPFLSLATSLGGHGLDGGGHGDSCSGCSVLCSAGRTNRREGLGMRKRGVSPPSLSPLLPPLPLQDTQSGRQTLPFSPSQAPHFPGLSHTHQQLVSPKASVPPLLICLPVSLCQKHPYLITSKQHVSAPRFPLP